MKTVLTLQITLFLLIAVGFVVKKMHIVGYQGQKNLNDLVIYVILPCNIIHAFTEGTADGSVFVQYLEITRDFLEILSQRGFMVQRGWCLPVFI